MILFSFNTVNATESVEITNDVEIKYRWYKEVIIGDYYPLQNLTSDDKIDITKIKYGDFSGWNLFPCTLKQTQYDIEKKEINEYKKVKDIRYILLENFNYHDNIEIYYENNLINYNIISNKTNELKIDLQKDYIIETLLFNIDSNEKYKMRFYSTNDFKEEIISKEIDGEKIIVANKSWITDKTIFTNTNTEKRLKESDLTKRKSSFYLCRYREIYAYKYEIIKEYYDNNYYSNVDGYIKDINDYKIFYKGKPITNTIEITKEKIVKEPQIEYIYIESKENKQEIDSSKEIENKEPSQEISQPECITKVKTEIVEKEIFKTNKITYIIIIILITTVVILIIKISKKYVR